MCFVRIFVEVMFYLRLHHQGQHILVRCIVSVINLEQLDFYSLMWFSYLIGIYILITKYIKSGLKLTIRNIVVYKSETQRCNVELLDHAL